MLIVGVWMLYAVGLVGLLTSATRIGPMRTAAMMDLEPVSAIALSTLLLKQGLAGLQYGGAGSVFDPDRLPEAFRQLGAKHAADRVGGAAWREPDQQADWPVAPGGRRHAAAVTARIARKLRARRNFAAGPLQSGNIRQKHAACSKMRMWCVVCL